MQDSDSKPLDAPSNQHNQGSPEIPLTKQEVPSTEKYSHRAENGKHPAKPTSPPSTRAEIIIAFLTFAILVTYIGLYQLSCSSLELTRQAIRNSNESTASTLLEMKNQSKAMQDAAKAASDQVKISRDALNATIAQSSLDQRPWVGHVGFDPAKFKEDGKLVYLKENESVVFTVRIKNLGKTPARNLKERFMWRWSYKDVKFLPVYPTPSSTPQISTLFPGTEWPLDTDPMPNNTDPTPKLSKDFVNSIRAGTRILRLYGELVYKDIFDREHHTTFCSYLTRDLTTFTPCDTYNDAD